MREKVGNHVQKSCTEDDKKANSLAFRELDVPYHVHREDKDVNIGHSVRKAMDEECRFGIPADSMGRMPITGYRVALLIHLLTLEIFLVFVFAICLGVELRKGRGTYENHNAREYHPPYSDERDARPDDSSICGSGGET
jgi:hypothetical protein